MKRSLEDTIKNAYYRVDGELVLIKSALVSLCTEIDRHFRVGHGISIRGELDEDSLKQFAYLYPRFSFFNDKQLNRLLTIFLLIRGVNAHLYSNKPIFIDDDIADMLTSICEPKYKVHINGELTIYGSFYILMLLSHKYMIWPVITSFLKNKFFVELPNHGNELSEIQQETQKYFQEYCGVGKPIVNVRGSESKVYTQYLSDVIKKTLTVLFFDLEKIFANRDVAFKRNAPSFRQLLHNDPFLNDDDTIDKLAEFRNIWLHGYLINDDYKEEGVEFTVSIEYIFNKLMIFKTLLPDDYKYGIIHEDLNAFATSLFHFAALRVVEVGYKLLDNRLLTQDKIEERIKNEGLAVSKIKVYDPSFYDSLSPLLRSGEINWRVSGSKFTHVITRKTVCETLTIVKLESEKGFDVGGCHTNAQTLFLPLIDLPKEYQNKINGKYLDEYSFIEKEPYSKHFKFVKVLC